MNWGTKSSILCLKVLCYILEGGGVRFRQDLPKDTLGLTLQPPNVLVLYPWFIMASICFWKSLHNEIAHFSCGKIGLYMAGQVIRFDNRP